MFDALLRMQLGPIVERLVEMETQLEDLYRRAESFCRIGVCQEVDAASNTCKVSHGDLLTPAIRFFNPSAGAQTETRIPSVGEQCLLLNYGGGGHGCAVQHVRQSGYRQLVSSHGFSPRVAPSLEGVQIAHIDQSNESDMAFITRLAKRYCAVTKPFTELYVLAEAGRVTSLSGQMLPEVKLSVTEDNRPGEQAFITAKLDEKSRAKYEGCRVTWWDAAIGKQRVVQVGNAPFKTLRQRYQNEAEARAVAESELRRVGREDLKLLIDCPGNPLLAAEGLLVLDETWPSYMQGRWSITTVTHVGDTATGYRSSITASGLSS